MSAMVDALIGKVPPEEVFQPAEDDWRRVEERLALGLPTDYKRIIELYGDFYWARFLYLLNPFSENKYLNLFSKSEAALDAERRTRESFPEHYPLPLYPEAGGLLPFFITDNGDTGFWITKGQPGRWAILIKDARSPEFEVNFYGTAHLLYLLTSGKLQSTVLPEIEP